MSRDIEGAVDGMSRDIEGAVGGTEVADGDQHHVNQRPDAEPAEAEELADPLRPVAQVEPVDSEAAQDNAERQRGAPPVTLGPLAE